jgi:hypothetical protein
MIEITKADVIADIIVFEDRIHLAKEKLKALPIDAGAWKEKKGLKAKRKALVDDVHHIRNLIKIAMEALAEF